MKKFKRKVLAMLMTNNFGSSLRQQLFDGAPFCSELLYTAIPQRAASGTTATFTRATTSTWPNNDGYLVTGVAGEIGFVGARRVRNLLPSSEDLTSGWTATGGTLAAGSITESGATSGHYAQTTSMVIPATAIFIMQAEIKQSVGTRNIGIGTNSVGNAIFNPSTGVFVANDGATLDHGTGTQTADGYWPVWVKVQATTSNKPIISLYSGTTQSYAGDGASQVLVRKLQLEDVTAQTTQTAGEYVSVGVVQRNKILQSNSLPTSPWSITSGSVVAASMATPDGGSVANTISFVAGGYAYQGWLNASLNTNYCHSIYAKAGTRSTFRLWITVGGFANGAYVDVNLAAPSVSAITTAGAAVAGSAGIEDAGNGWYRIYISANLGAGVPIYLTINENTGTGGTLHVCNTQAEQATTPTAYQATGGSLIYHGSFVDGVKCFPTDIAGNAIPSTTLLGYQAEGARTNLCLQSQTFDSWTDSGATVTANSTVAPDGTTTADTITRVAGQGDARYVTPTLASNAVHAVSLWIKKGTSPSSLIALYDVTAVTYRLWADVTWSGTTPVFAFTNGSLVRSVEWANGLWRVEFLTETVVAANTNRLYLYPGRAGSANGETVIAWGAQVELGSFASSYIATTTVAVTRNADVLTYSGGDVPNLKTLTATFRRESGVSAASEVLALSDNTLNNTVVMQMDNATLVRSYGVAGGVTQWNQTASNSYTAGSDSKVAVTFATNDVKSFFAGTSMTADTSATVPVVTRLEVGMVTSLYQLYGTTKGIYGWTRNLSQSELGAITS